MTFIPPDFQHLKVQTLLLDKALSTLLGRYNLLSMAAKAKTNPDERTLGSLELLIARINEFINPCRTGRDTAKNVFIQLVNELRPLLEEHDEEKMAHASLFLLGGLLHRYFRILAEEDKYNYVASWAFFKAMDSRNSQLFIAIRKILYLPESMGETYREDDLKVIDVTTIIHSLEAFQDNMLLEDENQKQRYETYPHFAKSDGNFKSQLHDIIKQHRSSGQDILNQFEGVKFIQSLTEKLDNLHKPIYSALESWSKCLAHEQPSFNKLTLEQIEEHLFAYIKDTRIADAIANMLYTPAMKKKFAGLSHETFLNEVQACFDSKASFIALGGYTLLLGSVRSDNNLKYCIYEILNIESQPERLGDVDKQYSLSFLADFITENPGTWLHSTFFGGVDKVETEIKLQKQILTQKCSDPVANNVVYSF